MDGLNAVLVREDDQRGGKVVHKKRFTPSSLVSTCELARTERETHTIIAVVGIHAVTVVETLERERDVEMEIVVAGVLLLLDAREVLQQVLVHVERERPGRELLVVDRSVERERLVHDIDDLRRAKARERQSLSQSLMIPSTRPQGLLTLALRVSFIGYDL